MDGRAKTRAKLIVACAVIGAALPCLAARPDAPAAAADGNSQPGPASAPSIVEEDLARILLDRRSVPVTPPSYERPARKDANRPVDGTKIVDRRARLNRVSGGWYSLGFEDDPTLPAEKPRWVLPSMLLESLTDEVAREPNSVFRVSGETTVYKDQFYLLLGKVVIEAAAAADPPPLPRPVKRASPPATTSAPATTQATSGPGLSSDDILRRMLQEQPGTPVILPVTPPKIAPAPSVAPVGRDQVMVDHGRLIEDRVVRIMREEGSGKWWQVRFEADNTLREAPLRILPSALLEKTEPVLGKAPKFRISGVITQYRGKQYLLLRKVFGEREMGQF